MKELILWKEVDVKDADEVIDTYARNGKRLYLKRVVIPILSDQEIEPIADKHIEEGIYFNVAGISDYKLGKHQGFIEGYKAKQNKLIGGEGL